jgi:hypothetical protein
VALLLAGGMGHGHQAFGEEIAPLALRAKRASAPENEGAQLALSVVVGGVNAVSIHECPQCLRVSDNVGARTRDVLEPGLGGALERSLHLLAYRYHPRHESLAAELSVPVVVPVVEDDAGVVEELSPHCTGGASRSANDTNLRSKWARQI